MDKTKEILKMAEKHGWWLADNQKNICMLIFKRGEEQINVYWSKMTVTTVVDHPKQGRQQLYRKNVTHAELYKLFANPRQHTGKGYRNRIMKFFHF